MIIFDCDGVLVDSKIISNQVDSDLFATIGYAISPDQMIRRFSGMTKRAIWEVVAREHGVPFPEALFAQANAMIVARYAAGVAGGGAAPPRSIRRCSAPVRSHAASLRRMCSCMPRRNAARSRRIASVEDSPAGVQAGLAAGMRVIGFTGAAHSYPGHDTGLLAEGATVVIPHMDTLAAAVAALR